MGVSIAASRLGALFGQGARRYSLANLGTPGGQR